MIVGGLLAVGSAAGAVVPAPPSQLGLCAACHGKHGKSVVAGVPNLAGQRYAYLINAMHQYRDGRRNVAVMRAALGPLRVSELKALAHWYAAQPLAPSLSGGSH
ncbi:c-type cytochrome [Oleiagrimonas sp.]|jgi:cytochrome c553|uniref:c-type cytochrome n=1 Tax=Oleiagrimonas sp. TaxID=2010330 RepID=UPI0026279116|nr:c-type cytochrome [Oleiagrimonas sp.]MDA3914560.1 c-type cytochrome [Oleiagrimonas sp.]